MSIVKKYVFVFASILLSVKSFAQAPSPFSTFGIGEPYGNATANTQGMAGTGVSQPQFWYLNNQNPALLVFNTLTVFQAGIIVEQRTIKSDTLSQKVSGGNMNYLITAFPVKPGRWTTSIGLMPMTSVNYNLQSKAPILLSNGQPGSETVDVFEEGSGGLTQLYWGNGVRLNDNFAVGAKISYVFSSVITSYKNRLPAGITPVNYFVTVEEQTAVKDVLFGFGLSYSKDSVGRKNYRVSIGATGNFGTKLKATRTTQFFRATSLDENIEGDSLPTQTGHYFIPSSVTAGISLSRGLHWNIGTEISMQNWASFRSLNTEDEGLGQSWRWSVGGEYTPDPIAIENYLKRVTYRLGLVYEKTPYLAPFENPQPVYDYGATFGVSAPAGRSSLDLGFKFGKRGNKKENLFEESYFRIYFGITFNDQWFIKRKFD